MEIKKIEYLNWVNDSLDVIVTLENDTSYLVEVATLEFLSTLMEKGDSGFVPAGYPYIIVSKLTDEIIRAAIQEFIDAEEDSYWLKLYHITATLKIKDIDEILDRKEKENMELEAEIDAEIAAENEAEN
jgi:hypothetical protein